MKSLYIVTGISGAGKTTAMMIFEEMDYYCLENIPVELFENFLVTIKKDDPLYDKVAVSVFLVDMPTILASIKHDDSIEIKVIFLDCSTETIFSRFRLTRHVHPLQVREKLSLDEAVKKEKETLAKIRHEVDNYYDTTGLTEANLRFILKNSLFSTNGKQMTIHFYSFGYKHGVPSDCDIVLDMRLLPNPFYIDELKEKTGLDIEVRDYVYGCSEFQEMISKIIDYLDFYLRKTNDLVRPYLNVAIGCSGGQHRSVVIAEYLNRYYIEKYKCIVTHRDLRFIKK